MHCPKSVSSALPSPLRMTLQIATDFNLSQAQLASRGGVARRQILTETKTWSALCECVFFSLFRLSEKAGAKGEAGRLKAIIMKSRSRKWRKHVYRKLCVVALENFTLLCLLNCWGLCSAFLRRLHQRHVHQRALAFLRRLIVMTNDLAANARVDRSPMELTSFWKLVSWSNSLRLHFLDIDWHLFVVVEVMDCRCQAAQVWWRKRSPKGKITQRSLRPSSRKGFSRLTF